MVVVGQGVPDPGTGDSELGHLPCQLVVHRSHPASGRATLQLCLTGGTPASKQSPEAQLSDRLRGKD